MAETTRPDPSELWMPLFGIETDVARAAQLRRMLDAVPWELADQLYGSREAMEARVARIPPNWRRYSVGSRRKGRDRRCGTAWDRSATAS